MQNSNLTIKSMALALLLPFAATALLAQDIELPSESNEEAIASSDDADLAIEFHLKGTLISQTQRSALVNNKVYREGDHVGPVQIVAIESGQVRILSGSQTLALRVGSRYSGHLSAPDFPSADSNERLVAVAHGDTLSQIAERHRISGLTINQMMIALFQANQAAFGDNIHVLRAGAVLRVPDLTEPHYQSPQVATAAVVRHTREWRTGDQRRIQLAALVDDETYGPVASGETLSAIAARVSPEGITMNQMMIALAHANPQAFGGSIDILREGAVLRIPGVHELRARAPEAATAEALRLMDQGERQAADRSLQDFLFSADNPQVGSGILRKKRAWRRRDFSSA